MNKICIFFPLKEKNHCQYCDIPLWSTKLTQTRISSGQGWSGFGFIFLFFLSKLKIQSTLKKLMAIKFLLILHPFFCLLRSLNWQHQVIMGLKNLILVFMSGGWCNCLMRTWMQCKRYGKQIGYLSCLP